MQIKQLVWVIILIHFQNGKEDTEESLSCCLPNRVEFSGLLEAHQGVHVQQSRSPVLLSHLYYLDEEGHW